LEKEIIWNASSLSHFDPRTNQCELEVHKIVILQNIANQLPDAFTDLRKITKSHIPAVNTPAKVDVPEGLLVVNEFKTRVKCGRLIGSKDKNPRKRKEACDQDGTIKEFSILDETIGIINEKNLEEVQTPEEVQVPENNESDRSQ